MSDLAKPERLSQQGMSPINKSSISSKRWSLGLLAAVALHSAGGALLLLDDKAPAAKPETVITVQLAAKSASESVSAAASTQVSEQLQEPQPRTSPAARSQQKPQKQLQQQPKSEDRYEPTPLAAKTAAKPDRVPQTRPQSQLQPQVKPEPVSRAALKTSVKTAEPTVTPPTKNPVPQQVTRSELVTDTSSLSSQAAPVTTAANITQSAATDSPSNNSSLTETASAASTQTNSPSTKPTTTASQAKAPTAASAKAAKKATQNYYAMISAHLNRHKSYSAAAKKQQLTGVVTVRFTVEPNGVISASSIKTSSGHALLDDETLKLLARVSPLPPMPADMSQEPVSISLPINYQLQTR